MHPKGLLELVLRDQGTPHRKKAVDFTRWACLVHQGQSSSISVDFVVQTTPLATGRIGGEPVKTPSTEQRRRFLPQALL